MNTSALYPSNLHRFGDDVIGKVVLRVCPPSHMRSTFTVYKDGEITPSDKVSSQVFPRPKSFKSTISASNVLKRPYQTPASDTLSPSTKRQATSATITEDKDDLELRCSRRRANMQRYRNKLRKHAVTLEEDVQQLREDIQKLRLQHDTTLAGAKESTAWSVAAEYFRLFLYGLKNDLTPMDPSNSSSSLGSNAQRAFLCANVAPDVIGSTGCGAERLVDDFQKLTLYLPNLSTQLVRLETGVRDSILASTRVEVTFTANVMRLAFPHLIQNDKWSPIAITLLDQQFVLQGSTHFEWDSEDGRVTLLQSNADLLTPMLELLGDLKVVAHVFEGTLITPECTVARRDQ